MCAGAVGSPHILLLSGIGPSVQLQEVGIDIISDVPVGENLQDHMILPLEYVIHSDNDRYVTVIHPSTILSLTTFYQYILLLMEMVHYLQLLLLVLLSWSWTLEITIHILWK